MGSEQEMKPLSYEIAVSLKEAGWPQPQLANLGNLGVYVWRDIIGIGESVYSPSLEELSEACPETIEMPDSQIYVLKFKYQITTIQNFRFFIAYLPDDETKDHIIDVYATGSSLKEAFAVLWRDNFSPKAKL